MHNNFCSSIYCPFFKQDLMYFPLSTISQPSPPHSHIPVASRNPPSHWNSENHGLNRYWIDIGYWSCNIFLTRSLFAVILIISLRAWWTFCLDIIMYADLVLRKTFLYLLGFSHKALLNVCLHVLVFLELVAKTLCCLIFVLQEKPTCLENKKNVWSLSWERSLKIVHVLHQDRAHSNFKYIMCFPSAELLNG